MTLRRVHGAHDLVLGREYVVYEHDSRDWACLVVSTLVSAQAWCDHLRPGGWMHRFQCDVYGFNFNPNLDVYEVLE